MAKRKAGRARQPVWANYTDDELLDLRLCDLRIKLQGSWLESRVERVKNELLDRDLRLRPHFWFSSEWFTPDGIGGVALPFYLAHPRLMKLEESQMLDVEGGTDRVCMKILRHELGHAISNAYRLHRRKRWREIFGSVSKPYPDFYQPRPHSRRFVIHLDYWYAQSHPSEDFAETFAVWLRPNYRWRSRYRGWSALAKLEYVNELMKEIAGKRPPVRTREVSDPLSELKHTLREHYEEKRSRYGTDFPDFYDSDLRKLFADPEQGKSEKSAEPAARFLRRSRKDLRGLVSRWTGEYQYTIDQVLHDMIVRARELNLVRVQPEHEARMDAAVLLAVTTMNYLHSGYHRLAV